MKILAIETELKKLNANSDKEILKQEALAVLDLQQKDILREIYFDENHCAVLILECSNKTEAGKILSELPLAKSGFIQFEIKELQSLYRVFKITSGLTVIFRVALSNIGHSINQFFN